MTFLKNYLPSKSFPILIIGAGGIVSDAHLPAYTLAGFKVWGLCDTVIDRANTLASQHNIDHVFEDSQEAINAAPDDAVFDIALPASLICKVLKQLPNGAHVLIQKPMGETLGEAKEILKVCRQKKLHAAINCQMRFVPYILAAKDLIDRGEIGEILDMEVRVTTHTPWNLFPFLEGLPRLELNYHSVHYIDLIRSFLGNPHGVFARTVPNPKFPGLASTDSIIVMDYDNPVRSVISTRHSHYFGEKHQESYIKWEGTKGAIKAQIGLLLNYPSGGEDSLEICRLDPDNNPTDWQNAPFDGSWFPHAFMGTMGTVMQHKEKSIEIMPTSVEDVIYTMACVEAGYAANEKRGEPLQVDFQVF